MARSSGMLLARRNSALVPPAVTLAFWRLRRTAGLLFVTGIGIVVAVLLVCAVPLYADISMTAGLRGILTASGENADIIAHSTSLQIDTATFNAATTQLDHVFQRNLGAYLAPSQFSIETNALPILNRKRLPGEVAIEQMQLVTFPMDQAVQHARVLRGRLPQDSSQSIEIALTQESASKLHVTVGSVIKIGVAFVYVPIKRIVRTVSLQVVGIFSPATADDPFWHQHDFLSLTQQLGPGVSETTFTGLASTAAYITALTNMAKDPALHGLVLELPPDIFWYYRIDPSRVGINDLDTIVRGITTAQVDVSNIDLNTYPYIQNTQMYLPTDIIQQYHDRIPVARLPVLSLLALVLGLVLFFVSMMTDLLVDRQSDTIATLRSRGASRFQIFGSIMIQSLGLGLVAAILGPALAVPTVYFMQLHTLAPADQGVLSLITDNPLQVALGLGWYALAIVGVAVLAMAVSVARATRLDVLALRREAARTSHKPLWQRLNLDIVAIVIMVAGYGFLTYLTSSNTLDAHLRLLLVSPLTLLGSVALVLACLLLFLRLFPALLGVGARLAGRTRGAVALLALAQMARTPRQAMRMTLLLALATAFAIFTLVFTASQAQRIIDVTAHQGGADFSGTIHASTLGSSFTVSQLAQDTAAYRHIPGVASASLGYEASVEAGGSTLGIPIDVRAVDADTFAQTAIWTEQDSSQPCAALMHQLASRRAEATASGVVPAIVDTSAWNALHLSQGAPFTLNFHDGLVKFLAIAQVDHIPTVSDSSLASGTNDATPAGGILIDFTSFANVYLKDFQTIDSSGAVIPMNTVWLRVTSPDNPAVLKGVRKALSSGELEVDQLYDREALIASLRREPLYLDLLGVLALGASTSLLLALLGNLLASWLNARSRLTNFAVLRALGTSPREIASVLAWELALIYSVAVILGIFFGVILSYLTIPALIFTSVSPHSNTSSGAFFVGQSVPPIQIVIPPSLGIALGVLIAICIIALGMMIGVVSRPSISQTLRLNED